MRSPRSNFLVGTLLLLLGARVSEAVVVAKGDGTQNVIAPGDTSYLGHVTPLLGGTAVYLGSGWLLSAYHVVQNFSLGSVSLGGSTYEVDQNSVVRILDPTTNAPADLALLRLTTVPANLGTLAIASSTSNPNTSMTMAGNGLDRAATETHWNVANGIWSETTGAGLYHGYMLQNLQGAHSLRWGVSPTVSLNGNLAVDIDDGYGTTRMFGTVFKNVSGAAEAANGDSGGAVFRQGSNGPELSGTMLTTNAPRAGQPETTESTPNIPNTVIMSGGDSGDLTFSADLSYYRAQIVSTIPEPGVAALAAGAVPLIAGRRRRARGVVATRK